MALKVLIVDDSQFFQRQLSEIINENPQLNVVGLASNGQEAIDKVKKLKPDLVTMDYEMPGMDGVTAVRSIMSENPVPILMLSSMTYAGAKITMDALDAGAAEFMTKNFSEISAKGSAIKKRLYDMLIHLGKSNHRQKTVTSKPESFDTTNIKPASTPKINTVDSFRRSSSANKENDGTSSLRAVNNVASERPISSSKNLFESSTRPKILAIGSSTGGPAALTELLKTIPKNFPLPILLIQHMPENFTLAFAERLNKQCHITVKEAEDGDQLIPGRALLAPGGRQLILDKNNKNKVKIFDSKEAVNYTPCVDVTFASLCNNYGGSTLAIVLTGMGSDGRDGARLLKGKQATVWTQSQESCVIYGMPMAVDKAGLSNASLDLSKMSQHLIGLC